MPGGGTRGGAARWTCPCLHDCLSCVESLWQGFRLRYARRRNSFRLFLYHLGSSIGSFSTAILATVFYGVMWGQIKGPATTCTVDRSLTTDAALRNHTLLNNMSVSCKEDVSMGACELSDLKVLLDFMMLNGAVSYLQFIFSLFLALSFRVFTNLPREQLQYGKSNRCTSCVGGFCKWGPWFTRSLYVFQVLALLVMWISVAANTCKGDLALTSSCENYQGSCAYNKAKNCQYYFKHCVPDEAKELACLTIDGRSPFSGRMDIRLLTDDTCARCKILEADSTNVKHEDEWWLLDASDKSNSNLWRCTIDADKCFRVSSGVWANLASSCCTSVRLQLNMENAANELFKTCAGRRLIGAPEGPQPGPSPGLPAVAPAEASAPRGGRLLAAASRQACGWAPDRPEFHFEAGQCSQDGSFAFSFSVLYIYFVGVFMTLLTFVGQVIRVSSVPEPWFFNPNAAKENRLKKLLRYCGP